VRHRELPSSQPIYSAYNNAFCAIAIVQTLAYEAGARPSADNHWLAYVSNESGRNEVYVRPFQGADRRWKVSTDGGSQPVWNPNGQEIFYRIGDRMMAVAVTAVGSELRLSAPQQPVASLQSPAASLNFAFGHEPIAGCANANACDTITSAFARRRSHSLEVDGRTNMAHRLLLLVIVVAAQLATLGAQSARPTPTATDAVDQFVAAEMARRHIPGLSLAVLRNGKTIQAKGYGVADIENEVAVTPDTVFKIGSVSKQFLATGIMLLAQDGRLSIDDPITEYLADAPESWRPITVRHFLTHTSGVLREGPAFDPLKLQPDIVVIRSAFRAPLEFATGTKYQYCNVCYFTLAEIIARVSGQPWDAFLNERVFLPMGMSATRTTTTTALVPRRARGYVWQDNRYVNAQEFLAVRPSGAFLSTAMDLAKWDAALYDDRILTKASREEMWKPTRLAGGTMSDYGFGWQLGSIEGHRRVHHGGSLPGFRAEMARFPDDGLTVIVLTNADGAVPAEIAAGVARRYFSSGSGRDRR
jgi:CubicO group peptidase (beta-lactamase class C family)